MVFIHLFGSQKVLEGRGRGGVGKRENSAGKRGRGEELLTFT
jgi:hypothetical protein